MIVPSVYQVESVVHETEDIFTLTMVGKESGKGFCFLPGQFNMLYHFGYGEVAISITGNSSDDTVLTHSIRAVGNVTRAMQKMKVGDEIGVRGPFGTSWPIDRTGCDVLLVAGGCGLIPLFPALYALVENRKQFGNITLLYGARSPSDFIYQKQMEMLKGRGIQIELTVDKADETWKGRVGVVTPIIKECVRKPDNTLVMACGPDIMFRFAVRELLEMKVKKENVYLSLERHMQCGLGVCGRCQVGPYFVCKDGPVFSYAQLEQWLNIKEL